MIQAEGVGPGAEVEVSRRELGVRFGARGMEAGDQVDLVANGAAVASCDGAKCEHELTLPAGGWVAARCWGGGRLLAHTSPVYVRVPGVPPVVDPTAIAGLDRHLARAREWVESAGRFTNPKSRDRLIGIFDAARKALLARAGPADGVHPPP